MKALGLLLPLLLAAPVGAQRFDSVDELVRPARVRRIESEGREWYDVRAQNAQALVLLREIGRAADRELYGLEHLSRSTLVTVELERRPLEQVLEFLLGSLGLRFELQGRTVIRVIGDGPESITEHIDVATASWMRASRRFPDHPAAPEARLAIGELAEARGLLGAARTNYLTLVEDYPRAAVVGEAYMRAGRISASMGQWGEAAQYFRTLANMTERPEYAATARLEWARSMIAQGDAQSALYVVNALETEYPANDVTETTARRLVKARAYNELARYMEALQEIDQADGDFDSFGAWEALHIRAVALEGVGLPAEAARAWLLYAREAKGEDRKLAYTEAARLSLTAEDELAVLFIVQQSELSESGADLESFERTARERLGLAIEGEAASTEDRIHRAEQWLEEGDPSSAGAVFQSLFLGRGALPEDLGARVCVGWARCLEAQGGLAPAIELLREVRPEFTEAEARQRIDLGAASLFESNQRFDDAIEAYQGNYAQP